jgi:hypothetical protein
MVKASTGKLTGKVPVWKSKWPSSGDLRAWFLCGLQKCEAIADPSKGSEKAHLPIGGLAELGHTTEALKYVDRCLRRLVTGEVLETVRMATLGAEICIEADSLERMEKYLSIMQATEKYITRKCDRGFALNAVREFRSQNGILDPAEAIDDEQRLEAIFEGAKRRCRESIKMGIVRGAQTALSEMEQAASDTSESWRRNNRRRAIISLYGEIGDLAAVKRIIRNLTNDERQEIVDFALLAKIGMTKAAIAEAVDVVQRRIAELTTDGDPNIHFPVREICRALEFLVDQHQEQKAKRLFHAVLESSKKWTVFEQGWTTAAVYTMFAEIVVIFEGPEAAQHMIALAQQDASNEKRSDFRKGAVAAALGAEAGIGNLDEAIAKARKLRSPTARRMELGKLLAKARRWKELRVVCSEATSPEEAADLCWGIKFELPGGESR